jgi:preprotein translocase subunit SecA
MKFNFLKKLFGSTNERKITALNPIVQKINSLEESIKKLSDSELKVRTEELRKIAKESKDLDKTFTRSFCIG